MAGENSLWYGRFCLYLDLGSSRSFLATYNEERKRAQKSATKSWPKSWEQATRRFRWRERSEAFDDYQRHLAEEQDEAARQREQEEFLQRRQQHREQELALAQQLRIKAEALLALPVLKIREEQETEDGMLIRILVPDHQPFRVAVTLVKQFSETARAALNMPVQRATLDLSKLSTQDLLAFYSMRCYN
ncbi:MAG: hypothetical protein AB7P18_28470 [Candidatus Binatia bacterium]